MDELSELEGARMGIGLLEIRSVKGIYGTIIIARRIACNSRAQRRVCPQGIAPKVTLYA